jgi:8-amino-7-oxononanoate synthase
MDRSHWQDVTRDALARRDESHLLRRRQVTTPLDATHVELDGRRHVNFASNNYLALTHHPRVVQVAREATSRHGAGSGAAALITGYGPAHAAAERRLARWKSSESAVLLPSGYQANLAAVQTLAAIGEMFRPDKPGQPRFLVDKLVHASLVDAVRASGAPFRVFPHNHTAKLRRLLSGADSEQLQVVVTESVFSMDGDAADLEGLAALKRDHAFVLLLDEAHAAGVYGPGGSGLAAERRLQSVVDVSVVTLSKALGVAGGAVCASSVFCDALVNFGRAYIFSTNLPPSSAAAAQAAVDVMADEPWRQARVRDLARSVRARLKSATPFPIPEGDSPIIPIILDDEQAALAASDWLREQGLLVPAVRPPTVPRGGSRLRVTLSCGHTDDEVDQLVDAIRRLADARPG